MKTRRLTLFSVLNTIVMLLIVAAAGLPFLHVVAKAFSSETAVIAGKVLFLPRDLELGSIAYVAGQYLFRRSFLNSVFITVVGATLSVTITAMAAYPLSKPALPGRPLILGLFVFTMLFSGGLVPTYMLIRNVGLLDSLWSLILPGSINVFYLLLMKNFFETLPDSIEESAIVEGAPRWLILVKIVIPLSMPAIATVTLFYAVLLWNSFFDALMYINSASKSPLQLYLRGVILEATMSETQVGQATPDELLKLSPESIRAATIVLSTLPIVLVYPFLQRYFVKGIVIGSIKG